MQESEIEGKKNRSVCYFSTVVVTLLTFRLWYTNIKLKKAFISRTELLRLKIYSLNSLIRSYLQRRNILLQNSFTAGEGSKNHTITSNLQIILTETQRQAKNNAKSRDGQEPAKGKKNKEKENSGKDKVKSVILF